MIKYNITFLFLIMIVFKVNACTINVYEMLEDSYIKYKDTCIIVISQAELIRRDYVANSGWETFLSYEDPEQDILIGLLRLRKCSDDTFRPELKAGVSIVRELHVYGSVVPVHARDPTKFQHQVTQLTVFNYYFIIIDVYVRFIYKYFHIRIPKSSLQVSL